MAIVHDHNPVPKLIFPSCMATLNTRPPNYRTHSHVLNQALIFRRVFAMSIIRHKVITRAPPSARDPRSSSTMIRCGTYKVVVPANCERNRSAQMCATRQRPHTPLTYLSLSSSSAPTETGREGEGGEKEKHGKRIIPLCLALSPLGHSFLLCLSFLSKEQ